MEKRMKKKTEIEPGEHPVPALMDFETGRCREEEREADFPVFATEGYAMPDIMDGFRRKLQMWEKELTF